MVGLTYLDCVNARFVAPKSNCFLRQATEPFQASSNKMKKIDKSKVWWMERLYTTVLVLSGLALSVSAFGQAGQMAPAPTTTTAVRPGNAADLPPDVPPVPDGKSTILGGAIRKIDPVRDQFMLNVYGMKPMKILFDERTLVYRDGTKIQVHDLAPADHVSVQTTLDGSKIYALSVHVLTQTPQGSVQGRIAEFDPGTGRLSIAGATGQAPVTVVVNSSTAVTRQGQTTFTSEKSGEADLQPGALISLNFQPDGHGQGVAKEITVLATPGATFVFSGAVTDLNMANGYLTLLDPRDGRSYQIHFNPSDPAVQDLHNGEQLRIAASYDGSRYAATQITPLATEK